MQWRGRDGKPGLVHRQHDRFYRTACGRRIAPGFEVEAPDGDRCRTCFPPPELPPPHPGQIPLPGV